MIRKSYESDCSGVMGRVFGHAIYSGYFYDDESVPFRYANVSIRFSQWIIGRQETKGKFSVNPFCPRCGKSGVGLYK